MWRALLAIAWADGDCGEEETAYFGQVFDNLPRYYDMTRDQKNLLADALEKPEKAEALFPYINDPEVRGMLVTFAEDLVLLDGVVDPGEEAILQHLRQWNLPCDKEALRQEVRQVIGATRQEKEEIRQQVRGMSPLYKAVDRLLMRLGIDLIN